MIETSNNFFRGLNLANHISDKEISTLSNNKKNLPIWESYISYLKIIRDYMMCQEDLLFHTVVNLQTKFQSFLTIILSPLFKMVSLTSRILKKVQNMGKIPHDTILVTVDVVCLCPSITHKAAMKQLKDGLNSRHSKKMPNDELVKMSEFPLTNNFYDPSPEDHSEINKKK